MMIRIVPVRNVILILAIALASPQVSEAAIDISSGFWSTTFNCPEQKQRDAAWLTCDGLARYGDWTASTGQVEQITPLANMAAGGGGSGQRHWIGSGKTTIQGLRSSVSRLLNQNSGFDTTPAGNRGIL